MEPFLQCIKKKLEGQNGILQTDLRESIPLDTEVNNFLRYDRSNLSLTWRCLSAYLPGFFFPGLKIDRNVEAT